jgi:hypothetical protein
LTASARGFAAGAAFFALPFDGVGAAAGARGGAGVFERDVERDVVAMVLSFGGLNMHTVYIVWIVFHPSRPVASSHICHARAPDSGAMPSPPTRFARAAKPALDACRRP